jgi:hypothetical protein
MRWQIKTAGIHYPDDRRNSLVAQEWLSQELARWVMPAMRAGNSRSNHEVSVSGWSSIILGDSKVELCL